MTPLSPRHCSGIAVVLEQTSSEPSSSFFMPHLRWRSEVTFTSQGRSLSFYSRTDLDKALKLSGIDATPFRFLYPPLTQMAKRRKRIVHEADLLHGEPDEWGFADDWQLIMWLMAVIAFYYQLRISLRTANMVERAIYGRLRTAMASHVAFGKQVRALPEVPPELGIQALQDMVVTLESISSTLHLDPHALMSDSG